MERIGSHGLSMPKLGLGTWRMKGGECRRAVEHALGLGYRHIDTAEMYGNEEAVGDALAASSVPRREIHVTSKVWHDHLEPEALRAALSASLEKLRTDYLDLYLIHWPSASMHLGRTLEAMMRLKEEGRVRAIGVSNFTVALMRQAVEEVGAPIACNQVEYHVFLGQGAVLDYARAWDIVVSAYRPLAQGALDGSEEITRIARKHDVSPQQVALKFLLDQKGVAAIPKASRDETQRANLAALGLKLDEEDRRMIASLPKARRMVDPGWAPRWDAAT